MRSWLGTRRSSTRQGRCRCRRCLPKTGRMVERFSASMVVSRFLSRHGMTIDDLALAPVVVVSWQRRTIHLLGEAASIQRSRHWLYGDQYPLCTGEVAGHTVSLALAPIGAPATVVLMETMIACGARVLIGVGRAGSLQHTCPAGTLLLPTNCICEEGTSVHCLDSRAAICPSPRLAGIIQEECQVEGVEVVSGPLWTTDPPIESW